MSGQDKTYQKIAQVLEELFEIDPDSIHPDANLYQDGHLEKPPSQHR